MPTIWNSAPPAWDSALPCRRSLPESTSGIAADLTASATRTHAWIMSSPTISAIVAVTLPSELSLPSGNITPTATIVMTTAVRMLDHARTRFRWKRSMKTPMNGETNE
jgi:hypothetical protein